MRRIAMTFAALLALAATAPAADPPRIADERVVLRTVAGDLVVALYPEAAPETVRQFLHLVRLGVYDGTHFHRVHPGFVVQLSTAQDRRVPLAPEQQAAIHPLKLEPSSLKHRRGTLSLAHADNDANSGETSFSILLGDAPHLDGKYTIFGHLEQGWDVLDEFLSVPRDPRTYRPAGRLDILKAVTMRPDELAKYPLARARPLAVPQSSERPGGVDWHPGEVTVAGGIALMVALGVAYFYLSPRLPPHVLRSLNLLGVLLGGFLLLVLLVPYGAQHSTLGLGLFVGVLGLLKLMSQFESPA